MQANLGHQALDRQSIYINLTPQQFEETDT